MLRREAVTSIGSVVLAFLASQHHAIHMLLIAAGLGGAGISSVITSPIIRRGMILISLIMTGVTLYRLWRRPCSWVSRMIDGMSAIVSIGLVIWSVIQFGM